MESSCLSMKCTQMKVEPGHGEIKEREIQIEIDRQMDR